MKGLDRLVEAYRLLRDKKAELEAAHKARIAEINRRQELIENKILELFNAAGVESARTPHGTAYVSEVITARVVSRDAFFHFVQTHDAWEMLEARANKTAVKQFIDEHDGALPPGIDVATIRKINIRK